MTACRIAAANWMNPFWRADQVGAMQYSNKEAHGNHSCSLLFNLAMNAYNASFTSGSSTVSYSQLASEHPSLAYPSKDTSSPSNIPQCQQGSVPAYAVEVLNPSHVQTAVAFAAQYNLRLTIKSTGHDALGRSTAPDSLNLWMHRMKNITFHENFTPTGCNAEVTFPAVTAESGTQWNELYTAAEAKNLVVVGAMSASVSTGGGFLQGGGHSPLSPFLGLAADNVVEMQVVTADGRMQTANHCQNRDLFWAMRGGGGGTFGVVTSTTHITYPPFLNIVNVHFIASCTNVSLFQELLTNFIYLQSYLSEDNFWAGYSYITMNPQPSLIVNYLVPNCNISIAQESFKPLLNFTSYYANEFKVNMSIDAFPSFGIWHSQVLCSANPGVCSDPSGLSTLLASRLLPQRVLQEKAPQVAQAFMEILSHGVGQIVGHLVGGQAVAAGQSLSGQDRLNLLARLGLRSSQASSLAHSYNIDRNGGVSQAVKDPVSNQNIISAKGSAGMNERNVHNEDAKHSSSGYGRETLDSHRDDTLYVQQSSNHTGDKLDQLHDHKKSSKQAAAQAKLNEQLRFRASTDAGLEMNSPIDLDASRAFAKEAMREYARSSGETDAHNATNSVNPALRRALWHVVLLDAWADGEPGGIAVRGNVITEMNGILRDLSPGSGCYLNEADVNEPRWQEAFYGQHYERLKTIKDRVDPQGLFTCVHCVGSEEWTTEDRRLCRRPIV
ncbi:hypothetical protein KP509_13G096900 [Ceratopteris richardii]|nr:hypothetical protein KP509_13G096900 [Ceratopteris richardii]